MDNQEIMFAEMQKIKNNFLKQVESYRNYIDDASLDVPIECLCFTKKINRILKKGGITRVKDITASNLSEIETLDDRTIGDIIIKADSFRFL